MVLISHVPSAANRNMFYISTVLTFSLLWKCHNHQIQAIPETQALLLVFFFFFFLEFKLTTLHFCLPSQRTWVRMDTCLCLESSRGDTVNLFNGQDVQCEVAGRTEFIIPHSWQHLCL